MRRDQPRDVIEDAAYSRGPAVGWSMPRVREWLALLGGVLVLPAAISVAVQGRVPRHWTRLEERSRADDRLGAARWRRSGAGLIPMWLRRLSRLLIAGSVTVSAVMVGLGSESGFPVVLAACLAALVIVAVFRWR